MQSTRTIRRLLSYLRSVRLPFTVSLFLLLAVAALTAAKAWIIQPVVDTFLGGESTHRDLLTLSAIVAAVFAFQAALNWLYAVVARMASGKIVRDLRSDLFHHLSRMGMGYYVRRRSTDIASRVVNDITSFEFAAVNAVQDLMRDVLTVLLLIAILVIKDSRLALICIGIGLVVAWVLGKMSGRIQKLSRQVQEMVSTLNQQLTEMMAGMELVLGFGLGRRWSERFRKVTRDHYDMQLRATKTSASTVLFVLLIVGAGVSCILFFTGSALLAGRITPGDFGTFLAAIYLMQAPALTISNSVSKLSKGMAAADRALELFNDSPVVVEPDEPVALEDQALCIDLVGVSFRYRPQEAVLEKLSFSVTPGQLVAMVGDSGAGKSTVAKLLMRFYDPDDGEVRIGGVSLRRLPTTEIYSSVSYVSQDVFLFDETIDFNLRIGKPNASAAEIAEAMRIACITDLIAGLPDGLDSRVGEKGTRLSGGQRQRVAICRAILSEARVLVLDEATSALDTKLEQQILQNLVHASRTRTIFAVTHRLNLAEVADRILVLRNGRLAEQGTAAELIAANGEFARLKRAAEATLARPSPIPAPD